MPACACKTIGRERAVILSAILAFSAATACAAETDNIQTQKIAVAKRIDADFDRLDALYKHLHSHPELSYREEQSAARMAKELRELSFDVTEKIGGHGVVGIFKNGEGPTVLVRTDMDALPVIENTGVPYASKVRTRDKQG